ncbi:MAG: hypothetical protein PHI24_13990, partial [Desulfitobacteriaceae bacterium]|nr:hypothetical protein [Desulfitobacteriaceae bacterium]
MKSSNGFLFTSMYASGGNWYTGSTGEENRLAIKIRMVILVQMPTQEAMAANLPLFFCLLNQLAIILIIQ